jgi:hypothetical protein
MSEKIIFITVPGPAGQLAVHVAPVLTPPLPEAAALGEFPVLLNWLRGGL